MRIERKTMHIRTRLGALLVLAVSSVAGATVPAGFQDTVVASGLSQPAALTFAPDGRLFVAEKASGKLRVVKNGALLATPFLDVAQVLTPPTYLDSFNERGLLGVAFDPGFPAVPYVYVYYTVCKVPGSGACQSAKNRVARVRAGYQGNPDRADPASHEVLLDDIGSDAGNHNAGWLGFGPLDGKLYVSVGDGGANSAKAQDLGTLNGKVLRLEPSGAVPFDNPFVGLFGARPEIWAFGFRNPWRCRFHPDGRLFCADVGQAAWEEIDWVVEGGNYGWPITEGDFSTASYPAFIRPIYAYPHNAQGGSSITGGDFGSETSFPGDYQQSYFFADYSYNWLRRVVLAADGITVLSVSSFGTSMGYVTDLIAGPDGALYFTDIVAGTVRRVSAIGTNRPPVARATASPSSGSSPLAVAFSSLGSSDPDGDPITIQWDFGDGSPLVTAAAPAHTYAAPGAYTATLTVSDGKTPTPGTDRVSLPITVGTVPTVTIATPIAESPFSGGQTIALSGGAIDAEDGPLPASALRWEIRFHHDDHWHPYVNQLIGSPQSFATATSGETSANVSYRVILRATDSSGLTGETSLYIRPRTVTLTLATSPAGLQLTLDGQPVSTPAQVSSVVGVTRTIGAPSPQGASSFTRWSDNGVQVHTINTPTANTTYTAFFTGGPTTTTSTTRPPTTSTTTSTTSTTRPPTTSTTTSTTSTTRPPTTSTTTSTTSTTRPPTTTTTTPTASTTTTTLAGGWFGTKGIGAQATANTGDNKRLSPFVLTQSGNVTRLVVHLASPAGGAQATRPVIYRDEGGEPGALVAEGPQRSVTAAAGGEWVALPFAAPVPLTPGTYWLGTITGELSGATVHFIGATAGARVYGWDPIGDGAANPAGVMTDSRGPISIYAEYTPPGATTTTTSSTTTTSTTTSTTTTTAPPRRFGSQVVGSEKTVNTADNKRLSPFVLGESGNVLRLVAHLASPSGGSQRTRPVIYRDAGGAPGTLAAMGPEVVVLAARDGEWIPLPFAAPVSLAPGTYWLGTITGQGSRDTVHYLGTTPGTRVYGWDPYDDGASAAAGPMTSSPGPMSIYAEYTP